MSLTAPKFQPWKGPAYGLPVSKQETQDCGCQRRLLIVGESHYDAPPEGKMKFTEWVADEWRNFSHSPRYLNSVARLVRPEPVDAPVTRQELDACAFYNFVQVGMPTRHVRPKKADLQMSADIFPHVLRDLSPTHVLVTGLLCWTWLPEYDREMPNFPLGGVDQEIGEYRVTRGMTLAINIPHPSSWGFEIERWRGVVQEFLTLTPSK